MNTEGSSALKSPLNPKRAEMEAYLSSEGGYWLLNDIWRADTGAYVMAGIGSVRYNATAVVDLSNFQNEELKLEMKYFLLYELKNKRSGWARPLFPAISCLSISM